MRRLHRRLPQLAMIGLALLATSFTGSGPASATASVQPSGDAFTANSCVYVAQVFQYSCTDLGWYATAGGTRAFADTVGPAQVFEPAGTVARPATGYLVTLPAAVSCDGNAGTTVPCEMVGSHYSQVRTQAELDETYDTSGSWLVDAYRNPTGSTWSGLADTNCLSMTPVWCVQVGAAGTSKLTAKGVVYESHAISYSVAGAKISAARVPAPAGATSTRLTGVYCWRTSPWKCLAVGSYSTSRRASLPLAAMLTGSTWHLGTVPRAPGQASAMLAGITCWGTGKCVAVGVSHSPGTHPFAVRWASGRWTVMTTPAESSAGFNSVSCAGSVACYAVGWKGRHGLIETLAPTAASWVLQPTPATAAPDTGSVLTHVSCTSFSGGSVCQAVGYRFDPAVAPAQRTYQTLAEIQPGLAGWQLQTTPDP